MNPLLLVVAALAAVPLPPAAPTLVFEVRVLRLTGEAPAGDAADRLAEVVRRGTVVAAPRVTVFEGQAATVFAGHTRTFTTGVEAAAKDGGVEVLPTTKAVDVGTRVELTGRATPGGGVRARVTVADTRVGDVVRGAALTVRQVGADGLERVGVVTIEAPEVSTAATRAAVDVPAGGTVVVAGPVRAEEVRAEYGVPVLSRIPYVSRLFTTVGTGRETVRTYLVLTATPAGR